MAEKTGAIVLAGGKSSRMGEDKALLPFQGMTLLEHTLTTLMTMVQEIVVVTDRVDRYALPCGRIVADTFPESGPVGGILTGLMELREGSHIVVACDMPYLNAAVMQMMLKAATPEYDAVVPEVGGKTEPLCAIYRHTALPRLLQFMETGDGSARGALKTLRVKSIGEGVVRRIDPDLRCFINVNTPEDLHLLE